MIKTIRSEKITPTETHFEIEINGQTIQFAKWIDDDFCTDYEIFGGSGDGNLTDDEYDEVVDFIDESII
jgi:hypothetical protein